MIRYFHRNTRLRTIRMEFLGEMPTFFRRARWALACLLLTISSATFAWKPAIQTSVGLVNKQGNLVAPPIFNRIGLFAENGLAPIEMNGQAGYINPKGEIAIPMRFDETDGFSFGLALVKTNGKFGYINASGEFEIPPTLSSTFVDSMPNDRRKFSEIGLAAAEDHGKWGYIDRKGRWAIPPQFDSAFRFNPNGYARVTVHRKSGIINQRGEIELPLTYDAIGNVSENGLVPVKSDGRWGYVRLNGDFAIPPTFVLVSEFGTDSPKGFAQACDDDLCGFIDEKGLFVARFSRDEFDWFGHEPKYMNGDVLIRSKKTHKFGYADATGNITIAPVFDDASFFLANDIALVTKDGRSGYINRKGDFFEASPQIPYGSDGLNDLLIRFETHSKYGYKDISGEVVIPPEFDDIDGFDEFGIARFQVRHEGL